MESGGDQLKAKRKERRDDTWKLSAAFRTIGERTSKGENKETRRGREKERQIMEKEVGDYDTCVSPREKRGEREEKKKKGDKTWMKRERQEEKGEPPPREK